MKNKLINLLPYFVIFLLWFLFSYPYFINGLIPFPSDYLVNNFAPWTAYPEFAGPVRNGATPDVIGQIYPWKQQVIEAWKTGQIPLWNPFAFSGTPLLANYQSAALSPFNILYFVFPFNDAWSIQILLIPLLAGIFTYIFTQSLKISRLGSLISSISFMFCGFITTWMVYGTLPYAILFLPLALFSIEKFYQTRKYIYTALLSITIPLSFFSGHFQISIYFLSFVLAYLVFKYITKRDIGILVLVLIAIISGLFISSLQILPSVEFYLNAVRSTIFLKTEVIPWQYLPTFIAPDLFGNPITRNDWLGHYAEWNSYIGFIPLLLGFYTFRRRTAYSTFFILMGLVSIILSFQSPLIDLFVALKIPVLSTSAVSRIIVLFSFSLAVLAGFGVDLLLGDLIKRNLKPILIWLGVFITIFGLMWAVVFLKLFMSPENVLIFYSNLRLPSLIFAFLIIFVGLYIFVKNAMFRKMLLVFLVVAICFDMFRFATKWQPFKERKNMYPEVGVVKFLKTLDTKDRMFGNFGAELPVMSKVGSVEGYDPLYIGRYGEFVEATTDGRYHKPKRSVVMFSKNGQYTTDAFNLIGVKYIVHKVGDGRAVWAYPYWKYPVDQFKLVYEDTGYQVFENQKVLPRAFVVGNYLIENNNRDLLKKLFRSQNNLGKIAILEKRPLIDKNATGEAQIINYQSGKVDIKVNSSGKALLVLSDIYYPGWEATVNGKKTNIYRADYTFRAVEVPKGESIVEFSYKPLSFKMGVALAIIGIIVMIGEAVYIKKKK